MKRKGILQEVILGIFGGLVFVIFAYGFDAVTLAKANGMLPWLKFTLCAIPCILLVGVAAWLASRTGNLIIKTVVWGATAVTLSYLTSTIPFQILPEILRRIYPQRANHFNYYVRYGIGARGFIIMVMTNVLLFIGGLLFDSINEGINNARSIFGMILPAIILLAFFAGAGYTTDNNYNVDLRIPIIQLDEQLQIAADLDPENIDERTRRLYQRYTKMDVNLDSPRRLLLASFDDLFSEVNILVDFNGSWAICRVLSYRPAGCEIIN